MKDLKEQIHSDIKRNQKEKKSIKDSILKKIKSFKLLEVLTLITAILAVIFVYQQTNILKRQTKILDKQNELIDSQNSLFKHQNIRIDQQTNLQEAERRSALVFLFNNIMDKIDDELINKSGNDRVLSSQLIGRIAALSQALKPYRYLDNNVIIKNAISPEKGQLLLSLINSNIEPKTLYRIFAQSNFQYSELKGANFSNVTFKNIDLSYSNMENVNFNNSEFENVTLENVNLKNARLNNANFKKSMIVQSDLSYVEANSVKFIGCVLNDINFSNARLSKSVFDSWIRAKVFFGRKDLYFQETISDEDQEIIKNQSSNFRLILGRTLYYKDSNSVPIVHQVIHDPLGNIIAGCENLLDINFSNSNLSNAIFESVVLTGCKFIDSKLYDIVFYNSVIDESYFDRSKINKKSFNENFNNGIHKAATIGNYYKLDYDVNNEEIKRNNNLLPQLNEFKKNPAYFKERFNYLSLEEKYPKTFSIVMYVMTNKETKKITLTKYSKPLK